MARRRGLAPTAAVTWVTVLPIVAVELSRRLVSCSQSLVWHDYQGYWDESDGADSASFWDRTYRIHGAHGRSSYEWYGLGYADLQDHLAPLMRPSSEVLVVGCGDSLLSPELAAAGWFVTSIDFSAEVIARMSERFPEHRYLQMSTQNMTFPSESFDVVLDKGLSDCFDPDDLRGYFLDLRRVLRPINGVLVVVAQRLPKAVDLSDGWACEPQSSILGPLYVDTAETKPAQPLPGTGGTIPYYFNACWRS